LLQEQEEGITEVGIAAKRNGLQLQNNTLDIHTMTWLPTGVPAAKGSLFTFVGRGYQEAPFMPPSGLVGGLSAIVAAFFLEKSTWKERRL